LVASSGKHKPVLKKTSSGGDSDGDRTGMTQLDDNVCN